MIIGSRTLEGGLAKGVSEGIIDTTKTYIEKLNGNLLL